MPYDLRDRFAARTQRMRPSAIRDILKVSADPGVISLAGGLPAPELFPVDEFRAAMDRVLRDDGRTALQYGVSEGCLPLREFHAERLTARGAPTTPDRVLITNGSQQALDLLGKVFLDPGDEIVIETPSYLGAIQAFDQYQPRYATVPSDDDGMDIDALEALLTERERRGPPGGARPKFIYCVPNFQNPSGRTMSEARRRRLVDVARRHEVAIVEDDPYGDLRFEGAPLPSLLSLDPDGAILHAGTFSKILAPGIRLGWLVVPAAIARTLVLAKQPSDLHTSTVLQLAVHALVRDGFLEQHVRCIRGVYRSRRDAMVEAVAEHLPPDSVRTAPLGGLFLWVELAGGVDTDELLLAALRAKVAFVPGASFHVDDGGTHSMRLTFATEGPETIHEAVRRLGEVIATARASTGATGVGVAIAPGGPA